MAIKKLSQRKNSWIEIDLTGPQGNAFCLLGLAHNLAMQLSKDVESIAKEIASGDYEHLLEVFDREFGEYVDLYR